MARISQGGSASAGKTVTRQARGRQNLPVMLGNRPMFVYLHHPHRWTVLEGHVVMQLKELRFVDDPNVDPDDERAKWRKRGWTEIPWDVRGADTNYMREHEGPHGTRVYLSEWETPHRGSRVVVPDPAGYVTFLLWLKDNGKVPAPEIYVLEKLRDAALKRYEDYAGKAHASPQLKRRADRCKVDLDALAAEIDAQLGIGTASIGAPVTEEAPPKKKKRAARKKKAKTPEEVAIVD